MSRKPLARRLTLQSLEERATPATFSYVPASKTLTIVAANNDEINVETPVGDPPGYLKVTELVGAATVFDSNTPKGRPVTNLIVRFDSAANGTLAVKDTARIGGLLGIFAATGTQTATLAGTIGGNVTYVPKGGAVDTVTFEQTVQVGGKVSVKLGGGSDTVHVKGGFYGDDFTVDGGLGGDTVNVLKDSDIRINGSAKFLMGNGDNSFLSAGSNLLDVGNNFIYKGGAGKDTISLNYIAAFNATLRTGGNVAVTLDNTPVAGAINEVELHRLTVGGKVTFTGGAGEDFIEVSGDMTIGRDVTLNLLDGQNYFDPNLDSTGTHFIGGNFSYAGGIGRDHVYFDGATVGKSVTVELGKCETPDQYFRLGSYVPANILGALKINGGNKKDEIKLHHLYLGGNLTIFSKLGHDEVQIDDAQISGSTYINLGDGMDTLSIETQLTDNFGNLSGNSSFGGRFRVKGGAGDDLVTLAADDVDPWTAIKFGSLVRLEGDTDSDTLDVNADVTFLVTPGNTDDFENGDNLV